MLVRQTVHHVQLVSAREACSESSGAPLEMSASPPETAIVIVSNGLRMNVL